MFSQARVRVLALGTISLIAYWAIRHEALDKHLQSHSFAYMAGLGSVILISGLYFAPQRPLTWLCWGAISPFFGSAIGYALVTTVFYLQHGALGADISFGSRALIALGFPYFACSVWMISVALPLIGMVSQHFRPIGNRPRSTIA